MQTLCNTNDSSLLTCVGVRHFQRCNIFKDGEVLFKLLNDLTEVVCRPAMIFQAADDGFE